MVFLVKKMLRCMVWHKVGGGDASDGKMKITHRFRREHEYVLVVYDNKASTRFNKTLELPDFKNKYTNPSTMTREVNINKE